MGTATKDEVAITRTHQYLKVFLKCEKLWLEARAEYRLHNLETVPKEIQYQTI